MHRMPNRTFVGFWTGDHSEAMMLDRFQRFLESVPLSTEKPGFAGLVIRAVSPAETPLMEHDLRGVAVEAADVIALALAHRNADTSFEVEASWDLWERDLDTGRWLRGPHPLLLTCYGEAYDDGVAAESGHFLADVGFEHLFTGHGGLLGSHGSRSAPADPIEAEFLALMTHEEHLHEYYQKTRENIQQLLNWIGAVERALPIERYQLWSEGEENLEARLDEILAVH
jgi:hypothetical protein